MRMTKLWGRHRSAALSFECVRSTRLGGMFATTWVAFAMLSGCQAVTSEPFDGKADAGVPYSLPTALVSITVTKDKSSGVTIEPTLSNDKPVVAFVPDRKARALLQYHQDAFATDRLCVARSSSGLLNSVQFASDDATDEVLLKLAELAAKIGMKAAMVPPQEGTASTIIQFDPLDKTEQKRASDILARNKFGKFTFEVPEFQTQIDADKQPAICRGDAVCFREKVVTPLVIKKDGEPVAQTYITVADKWNLGRIRISRPFLVEEVTKIGFDQNGFLTSLSIKRPSEALAAAKLPLDIIDTILAVPGNFLGRAFGSFAERKQLLAEQAELAKAKPAPETPTADTNFTLQCVGFKTDPPTT